MARLQTHLEGKNKHRYQKQTGKDSTSAIGTHAPNVASMASNNLNHLTSKCPEPKKNNDNSEN